MKSEDEVRAKLKGISNDNRNRKTKPKGMTVSKWISIVYTMDALVWVLGKKEELAIETQVDK